MKNMFIVACLCSAIPLSGTFAVTIEHVGTYTNWPVEWTPVVELNDADDGIADQLDFVGNAASPGVYVADNGYYLFFRFRLDVGTAGTTTFRDAHIVFIDVVNYLFGTGFGSDQPRVPDVGIAWDSKSNDPTKHGLEMVIINVAGSTWNSTRMDDIDYDAGKKLVNDINGAGRSADGYIRTIDGQTTTAFGDTTFMDFAVSWSYLEAYTALRRGQTWNIALGSIPSATDHNNISADVAGGANPSSPTINGWATMPDIYAVPHRTGVRVLNDINGNGIIDAGERGIRSITVDLFSDPNGDGNPADGEIIQSRTTDYHGEVLFGNLASGAYVMVQTDLPGFASISDSMPPNDNRIAVTLSDGVDVLDHFFIDWTVSGLDIQKSVDEPYEMIPGQVVTYSVIVSNTRVASIGQVSVVDVLPDTLGFVAGSARLTTIEPIQTNTFSDTLSSAAYTNNNGTLSWASAWSEVNDDGRMDLGNVIITENLGFNRILISNQDRGVMRRLPDVSEFSSAQLSLDYRRYSLENGDYLGVYMSTNGTGGPWSEVGRLGYAGDGYLTDLTFAQTNFDITGYLSTNTVLLISTAAGAMTSDDMIYIDNLRIDLMRGGIEQISIEGPPALTENYTIEPNQCATFTYQAVVGFCDYVVNQVHVTSAGDPVGQYAEVSNVVASAIIKNGWICSNGLVNLDWVVSTNEQGKVLKPYEVVVADSIDGFVSSISNHWGSLVIVTNHTAVDDSMNTAMRFYRLSFPRRWTTANSVRYASKEIYVGKNILLKEGENFISLFMDPDTNTLSAILNVNNLPAGSNLGNATMIQWYGSTTNGRATNVAWLSSSMHWMNTQGGVVDDMPLPLHESFSITIPAGSGDHYLPVIGRLPTTAANDGHTVPIKANRHYNLISYNFPYRVALRDSGLREAGFAGAAPGRPANPITSDELRILHRGGGSLTDPKARILMNNAGQFVFWTGGSGNADAYKLEPDDALIIYTRVATKDYEWTPPLPYAVPQLNMIP